MQHQSVVGCVVGVVPDGVLESPPPPQALKDVSSRVDKEVVMSLLLKMLIIFISFQKR
jgi:hypothetical protein